MSKRSSPGSVGAPPLLPGYHFIISFCEVACNREKLDAIKGELIEVARNIIRTHNLRDSEGGYINTRVRINRTIPLLEEQLAQPESRPPKRQRD